MTTILHIDSQRERRRDLSIRRISAALVEALKKTHGDASVVRRDVHADRPPHVGVELRNSWVAEEDRRTPDQVEAVARSEGFIGELKNADVVVIGSPMYNFTVPSTLKAWIDHVAIAGETFHYTEKGPQGLLENKKAYLALSSGGVYTEGPASGLEHLGTYLTGVLGFMGIEDVEIVRAEGVAMGQDKDEAAMKAAFERVETLVGLTTRTPRELPNGDRPGRHRRSGRPFDQNSSNSSTSAASPRRARASRRPRSRRRRPSPTARR